MGFQMGYERSKLLLDDFPMHHVVVVGDFFLDKYLVIDAAKDESSVETGRIAFQVVKKRASAGAAGTVVNNLVALGIGKISVFGIIGVDGEGFELLRCLHHPRIDVSGLIQEPTRVTPTYTKPMRGTPLRELNRLDIKNWQKTPDGLVETIMQGVTEVADSADAIVVLDQVTEADCGVVTSSMRHFLEDLGRTATIPILVDSRAHIAMFSNVMLKPNAREAVKAAFGRTFENPTEDQILAAGLHLQKRTERPVFLTRGSDGQLLFTGDKVTAIPALPVKGKLDIVGAGDSTSAGIVSALCSGATLEEAAEFGSIVASITIQKIGETGTASPQEILDRIQEFGRYMRGGQ